MKNTFILAVGNQKGGVGKTTTSINLAASLSALKQNILLVDLDPQANATSGLGLEKTPGQSCYQALLGEAPLAESIHSTAFQRLDIVPSELDLAGSEIDIARGDRYLHRLREALRPIKEEGLYDLILLDCPPSLGILTMNAFTAADGLLIPLQSEYFALEGLSTIMKLVKQLRESGANPGLFIEGIVMTMFDGRTNLSKQVLEDVRAHFGEVIYDTVIPRSVRLGEAPSFGLPVIAYDPRNQGAVAYTNLGREFLKRRRASQQQAEAKPSAEPPPGLVPEA